MPDSKVPDYEAAARNLEEKTGFHVGADMLRQVARGYKRPSGLLAAALQTWSSGVVDAVGLLTAHYARTERAAS